ncbi:hypothetical protein SAMN04490244_101399 [Tranquillimonas rosea]|uniref:DUF1289 domain-containing protein n=1 Tax=Tranquillimonas rosea TaxID=641238 RepID=A0A1H9PYX3_9RHOB|nr:DUF1289 domain-containing protein [Tranquillimonas rosea]SER53348.1 hypothetical protein SAMN04490244_101399 [Tranquillimonas rosea]
MRDERLERATIQSPCVKICVVHPTERICTGCLRTLDEIAGWGRMDDAERQAVLDALPQRNGQLRKRRGGRAGRLSRG